MTQVTFKGNPVSLSGAMPAVGDKAPDFTLARPDLSDVDLDTFKGKTLLLNIFPSIDTPVCAASVRKFHTEAATIGEVAIVCASMDLPFAQKRFCGEEGIDSVETLSGFRSLSFGDDYGVLISEGPLAGLYARAVIIVDAEGVVKYCELVPEIAEEPNYEAALAALKS